MVMHGLYIYIYRERERERSFALFSGENYSLAEFPRRMFAGTNEWGRILLQARLYWNTRRKKKCGQAIIIHGIGARNSELRS
jgi:hypothetical protein